MGGDSERNREMPSQIEMRTEYNRYLLSWGLKVFPQKKYIEVLTPSTSEWDLIGDRVNDPKSHWSRIGL